MPRLDLLIVDSDPTLLGLLRDVLQTEGLRVRTAPDVEAGMEALRKRVPDILLCSLDWKETPTTLDLIDTARDLAPGRCLPIVLLTSPDRRDLPTDLPRECLRLDKTDPDTLCHEILHLVKSGIADSGSPGPSSLSKNVDPAAMPQGVSWRILDGLEEGIVELNPRLLIRRANSSAARLLDNRLPDDLIDRSLEDLFVPSSGNEVRASLETPSHGTRETFPVITAGGRMLGLRVLDADAVPQGRDETRFLLIREAPEILESIFPFLLEKSIEILDAEAGTVALIEVENGDQAHLAFRYALGEQAETIRGIYIPRGQGVIGWCVTNNEPVMVNDVSTDSRFFPWVDQMSGFLTRSILCLPIRSEGKVFGAIEIVNKQQGPFTRKDLERLQALVDAATFSMKTTLVQQRLISQRDYYSGIMDSLSEGVMIMGRDRRILDANQFFMMFLDSERHEIIGKTCHRLLRDRENPCDDCFLDRFRVFDQGRDFSTTTELPALDGETALFRVSGTPLEVRDEIVSSCILTFHDITRVQHLHDYLQASSSVASILLKGQDIRRQVSETLDIMGRAAGASRCYWFENQEDPQGRMHMVLQAEWCAPGIPPLLENQKTRRCLYEQGFSRWWREFSEGRIVSGSLTDFPQEEKGILKSRGVRSILLIPLSVQGTFQGFIGFDNCLRHDPWQEAEVNLLKTTANLLSKAFEHARSLEELRQSEARYRDIYENIYDSWYLHDMDGRFLEVNPAVERAVGYSESELFQMNLRDLIPARYHDRFARYFRDIREKGVVEGLITIRAKNGEEHVMEYRNWLVQGPDGGPASRGLVRDITERVNLKSQLKHAQRMESIGTIATGISHNFRNLLAGIMTNCQLIHMKYRHIPELERYSSEILNLTRAGSELIRNLLQFSRKGAHEAKSVINLSEVLEETLNIISRSFDKSIKIHTQWPELLPVYAEASSLSQVFMNLCTNARDAMPKGGTLSIEAREKDDRVSIRIQDMGVGMDKATLEKAYDPFFTTKPPGKGTGLGLSTAYGIVKQHGGEILIESAPNRGTTFEVLLPAPEAPAVGTGRAAPVLIPGRGQKVLIVDDDETILQPMIELLEALGYQASAVSNGHQAIEAHLSWNPDVILLDRSMPGMDGVETAVKILEADPHAWIILISGYDADGPDGIDGPLRESIKGYIPKPFDIEEVSKVLAEVLNP